MTQYARMGALLLIAMALGCGAVSAAQTQANLELNKTLLTTGQIFAGDTAVWDINLTNNGPDDATNINVTEDLGSLVFVDAVAGDDTTFDEENLNWTIPMLASGTSVHLTLTTTIGDTGTVVNRAVITAMDQADPDLTNNEASASAAVNPSTTATITIKPETLNLKSRGVFTVFIKFSGDYPLSEIDLKGSTLLCNGSKPQRMQVSQKDGGTVIAKYRRQDLVNVYAGDVVTITCEGTISAGGETVKVTGSDTIRVIGEKKTGLDAFFAGILDTVLPQDDEAAESTDGNATPAAPASTSGQDSLNRGQLKKAERNGDAVCTENCNAVDSQDTRGNGKKSGTDGQNSVTGSSDKGNKGNGNDKTADNGNGNGKNKPDNEKGNGKNKK